MAIDKLYWSCRETSLLSLLQIERCKCAAKVRMSDELLTILRSAEYQRGQYFVTFDESWFYLSTDYEII
jgi:hypothetical protein